MIFCIFCKKKIFEKITQHATNLFRILMYLYFYKIANMELKLKIPNCMVMGPFTKLMKQVVVCRL